jgi:hypothetical protein
MGRPTILGYAQSFFNVNLRLLAKLHLVASLLVIRGQVSNRQLTKVWSLSCVAVNELRRLHAALFAERKPSPALRNTPTLVGTLRPRSVDLTPLAQNRTMTAPAEVIAGTFQLFRNV